MGVTINIYSSLHCKRRLLGYTLRIFVITAELSYLRLFIELVFFKDNDIHLCSGPGTHFFTLALGGFLINQHKN